MSQANLTSHLFRRRSLRLRVPLIGAAAFAAGAVAVYLGHMGGVLGVVVGIALIGIGVVAGRKASVTIDANGVLLRFAREVSVAFESIEKVGLVNGSIQMTLHSGNLVLIPLAQLEDGDGEWLRKEIRRAVNQRRERVPPPPGSSPYSIS